MKKTHLLLSVVFCLSAVFSNAQYNHLYDFNVRNENPENTLIISGNVLYGTENGTSPGQGTVYSIHTDGTGFKQILTFNGPNGYDPASGKLVLSGKKLFGTTIAGGAHHYGCVFTIDTNGGNYKDIFDFNGTNGNSPNEVILSGNVLYGMTSSGGSNNMGVVFSVDTDGTNYNDLLDFLGSNGSYPSSGLILSGTTLYGLTSQGGANDTGVIFSVRTNGTGYTDILDFSHSTGITPAGDLAMEGNVLYGTTVTGGADLQGNIFSIHTDGTHYRDILDFNASNGWNPVGALVASGNILYGMTRGANSPFDGNAFLVDTDGTNFKNLVTFTGNNSPYYGSSPDGGLLLSNGVLYGVTTFGAQVVGGNSGVLFNIPVCNLLSAKATSVAPIVCNGDSSGNALATASGGPAPYSYSWSNGGTNVVSTNNPTGPLLGAGSYTVTITDNNGCKYKTSINITQPPSPLAISIKSQTNIFCNGTGNATANAATGGTSPYVYNWAPNGGTNLTASGLTAGSYTITAKDHNGCIASATVTITQSATPSISINSKKNILCNAYNTGSITANAPVGGTPPYTYNWAPSGGTNLTASGLTAGNYTITTTDNNGCTATAAENITQPAALTIATYSASDNGNCNGEAAVTPSGGTSPYTYLWITGNQTTDSIKSQCSGTYCCNITDNNGCSTSTCVTINEGVTGISTLANTKSSITIYPNPNSGNFIITGIEKGQIIEVYDALGQKVNSTTADNTTIYFDMSDKPNGTYLIQILNKDGTIKTQKKVIKE